jgi:hypothetical protein
MFFEISRGLQSRYLSPVQRSSSLFAEEPVVLGKTLRRGTPPLRVTYEQFMQGRTTLLRLLHAGSIQVEVVDVDMEPQRLNFLDAERELLAAALHTPLQAFCPSPLPVTEVDETATLSLPSAPAVPTPDEVAEGERETA